MNRIQSSRRLERGAQRNVELMWLTGRLTPDFKTIADFRKDNRDAIRRVCREFVMLCRKLNSFAEAFVAIDAAEILLRYEGSKTRREWSIPIPEPLRPDLAKLQQRTIRERGLDGVRSLRRNQVFNVATFYARYRGPEMTEAQLTGFFKRLSSTAGVEVSAHRMRHTLATELTRGENRDLKAVQDLLGHTDIRTTLRYVHTDVRQMRRLFEGLPAL